MSKDAIGIMQAFVGTSGWALAGPGKRLAQRG